MNEETNKKKHPVMYNLNTRLVLNLPDGNEEKNKLSTSDLYELVPILYLSNVFLLCELAFNVVFLLFVFIALKTKSFNF